MRTQATLKPRGEGQSSHFYSPLRPSLMAPSWPCLSLVIPPLRNLTHHWLTGYALEAKQGEGGRGGAPNGRISFVSLVAYGPKVFYSALATGITACETRQGSPNNIRRAASVTNQVFPSVSNQKAEVLPLPSGTYCLRNIFPSYCKFSDFNCLLWHYNNNNKNA